MCGLCKEIYIKTTVLAVATEMSAPAAIDARQLHAQLSRASQDFVLRQQHHKPAVLMQDMGNHKSNFWVALDEEFRDNLDAAKLAVGDEAQARAYRAVHVQKAAIVSELFSKFNKNLPGHYVNCALILVRAIEFRAPVMVLQVITEWCPFTLNYRNRVTGTNIVHLALMHQCSLEVIQVLACCQGDPALQLVDRDGLSVLHYAAMYRLPVDIVKHLYNMYPEMVTYRSTNKEAKSVSIKVVGVCRETDEETSLQDGAEFMCPARCTPLCVAVYRNRFQPALPDNSAVIIFLDQVSSTVKMVPDHKGNTAFMMLMRGIYPEEVMQRLLLAFCASHEQHARIIAFCKDHTGSMLLQTAIKHKMSRECIKIVCDFTIVQFERMNATTHEMWVHGHSESQAKLGIQIYPGNTCFNTDGTLTSVDGTRIKIYISVHSASQVQTDFAPQDNLLMGRDEAHQWCENLSIWVNPTFFERNRCEIDVLTNLIQFLGIWFDKIERLTTNTMLYEPGYRQVITYFQTAISSYHNERKQRAMHSLAAQNAKAQRNGDAFLAELEAEAEAERAAAAARAGKSASKSAKNARRRKTMKNQVGVQQQHTDANARIIDADAAEAGMDIPADPVASRVRQPSHAELEQARKNTYEQQQLLQQLEWECTQQARLARNIQASPVACNDSNTAVQSNDDEDDAFSDAFESAMRMCMPLSPPELSKADQLMRDSGWLPNEDRSRRFAEAVRPYEVEMRQALQNTLEQHVDDENINECILCLTNDINTEFSNCGHRSYCDECIHSGKITVFPPENKIECPVCRVMVDETIML